MIWRSLLIIPEPNYLHTGYGDHLRKHLALRATPEKKGPAEAGPA
jgi:hypothetical protein